MTPFKKAMRMVEDRSTPVALDRLFANGEWCRLYYALKPVEQMRVMAAITRQRATFTALGMAG